MRRSPVRSFSLALLGMVAAGSLATPANAEPTAKTRLVECGAQTCLRITGQREDAGLIVSINGNPVSVDGKERWQVLLPVETIREWSAPHARSVEISLRDPETQHEKSTQADLPIGLLGNVTTLAALEVTVS